MADVVKRKFTTVRKLSGVQKVFRKWDEWDTGDIVIGKYLETYTDNYGKPNYVIEVEEQFIKDKSVQLKGKNLALNHCGMLGKAMDKISFGQLVQIEYGGKSEMEKGKFAGKESHTVIVEEVEYGVESENEVEL